MAMLDLGMHMQLQACSVIISATKTPGYKYGNFVTAWKNLERRYEPRSNDQKKKLMDEFYSHKPIPLTMDPKDKWEDLLTKLKA